MRCSNNTIQLPHTHNSPYQPILSTHLFNPSLTRPFRRTIICFRRSLANLPLIPSLVVLPSLILLPPLSPSPLLLPPLLLSPSLCYYPLSYYPLCYYPLLLSQKNDKLFPEEFDGVGLGEEDDNDGDDDDAPLPFPLAGQGATAGNGSSSSGAGASASTSISGKDINNNNNRIRTGISKPAASYEEILYQVDHLIYAPPQLYRIQTLP